MIDGEYYDKESELPHIGHIQCNAMFLNGPNIINDLIFKDFKEDADIPF